jgi:hypothetical protein
MTASLITQERINSSLRADGSLKPAERPWKYALLLSAALSTLFIVLYGGSNALASQRALRTYFFPWEKQIPFVSLFIIPYLSIDLFFVLSFLLCVDAAELRTHSRRIAMAILISGVAFITLPLTVGYAHPEVSGWTGWLFEFLWSFDKPHNLVPSLHVGLASLLWPVYARNMRGLPRRLIHGWFAMIVVSPLLTWQHHVLDVVTGAMLGQFCIFMVPVQSGQRSTKLKAFVPIGNGQSTDSGPSFISAELGDGSCFISTPNLRIAWRCATASAALCILAVLAGSWSLLLLWPATSLAIIWIAYVRGDGFVFRKSHGRIPISSRVVLGPYLCGMFVRRRIYKHRLERWREIAPGVYCGRLPTGSDVEDLRATGITAVLDMTAEHSEVRAFRCVRTESSALPMCGRINVAVEYLNIPVLDLTEPSREQLDAAAAFILKHRSRGRVYVHCALGISRSVAAVKAYSSLPLHKLS